MKRMRVCDAAVIVLRETNNPAVMCGDSGLLHMIAERAGMKGKDRGWKTEQAVLDNLARVPGELIPYQTKCHSGGQERWVRMFRLPEHRLPGHESK